MKKYLICIVTILLPMVAKSQSVKIGNLYYSLNGDKTATVISGTNSYEGEFEIPESITYNDISYTVTSIGRKAFYGCSKVTSITLPPTIISLGNWCFSGTRITSIIIPEQLTYISEGAFSNCGKLETAIMTKVKYINHMSFFGCSSLKSLNLPSIESIAWEGLQYCTSLKSVSFGENLQSVADNAFNNCNAISDIYCHSVSAPWASNTAFSNINNITLHVPSEGVDNYRTNLPWSEFGEIVSMSGDDNTQKCEKPIIGFSNGKLVLTCETQDAKIITTITNPDIKTHVENEISLTATYNISAYATKAGYEDSDIATATLSWIDKEPQTEGIVTSIVNVPARALLIQNNEGYVIVQGLNDGERISVYTISGSEAGFAISHNGIAVVDTNLQSGSVGIVKVGEKSVKVVIK